MGVLSELRVIRDGVRLATVVKVVAARVGEFGRNRRERLYRLAVESAPAGTILHGTAEEGVTVRAIAETIGKGTGMSSKSIPAADALAHFGWMSMVVGLDNRASSEVTRELLGWKPDQPGLLDDMRAHYF